MHKIDPEARKHPAKLPGPPTGRDRKGQVRLRGRMMPGRLLVTGHGMVTGGAPEPDPAI